METTVLGYKLSDREDLSAYYLANKTTNDIKNGLLDMATLTLPNLNDAYKALASQVTTLLEPLMQKKKVKKEKGQTALVEDVKEKAETEEEISENT
jgi:hypothetical protein